MGYSAQGKDKAATFDSHGQAWKASIRRECEPDMRTAYRRRLDSHQILLLYHLVPQRHSNRCHCGRVCATQIIVSPLSHFRRTEKELFISTTMERLYSKLFVSRD